MTTIADACTQVQAALASVAPLATIPADPPEQLTPSTLPAAVVYPGPAQWELASHGGSDGSPTYSVAVTMMIGIYLARTTLPLAVAQARTLAQTVPIALLTAFTDHRFQGTVTTLGQAQPSSTTPPVRCMFGEDDWGEDMIRVPFELDVVLYVKQEVTPP